MSSLLVMLEQSTRKRHYQVMTERESLSSQLDEELEEFNSLFLYAGIRKYAFA